MSFAELVGRMSPKGASLVAGTGAKSTITVQDIAGAIADAERACGPDAVAVFLWRANPDMAERHTSLEEVIARMVAHEWLRQREEQMHRELREAMAWIEGRCKTECPEQRRFAWPKACDRWANLIDAVTHEWKSSDACMDCNGRGSVLHGTLLFVCQHCKGAGRRRLNDAQRSRNMKLVPGPAFCVWSEPYHWLLTTMEDMSRRVEVAGALALRDW